MTLHHRLPSILLALALCYASARTSDPEVHAPAGRFRGKILTSHSGREYASYRGIPYALPPTGDRRFALPVRHPVIEEIHNTTEFGSVCLQNNDGAIVGQENCLFVNVFTPLSDKGTDKPAVKKVLVYIYGGGYVVGASDIFLPGDLVTGGDIIVVTINYRLNWLGFLRGNSSFLPGNMGLWDQLLALQWVKDNIESFGGDPYDVTLAGESAGGMSVGVLSVSPLGKGLFTKGLMMSGAGPFMRAPPRTTNDILQAAADKFGCGTGSVNGREDAVVQCLKRLPGESFVREVEFDTLAPATSSGDSILPKDSSQLLNEPDYLSSVGFYNRDYIVSITADDGYILVNARFGKIDPPLLKNGAELFSSWSFLPLNVMKRIIQEYVKLYKDEEKALIGVATDGFFLETDLNLADAYAAGQKRELVKPGKQCFVFSFDHVPKYVPKQYMLHALDLVYLFDLDVKAFMESYYFLEINDKFHKEDFELKKDFIDLVVDFVKTGNPGKKLTEQKNVVWPPFDSEQKSYLSFSLQPSVRQDILGERRFIWDTLVPRWLQEEQSSESKDEL